MVCAGRSLLNEKAIIMFILKSIYMSQTSAIRSSRFGISQDTGIDRRSECMLKVMATVIVAIR